ncbi:MAG: hypothetical protein FJX40_11090 [Alphaproteobacteria bacterium]|nr:hypothetical protein [Alphaproteobacteria bacterium]
MINEEYVEKLEAALAHVLQPLKGLPFTVVVRALSNQIIFPIDRESEDDRALIGQLEKAIHACAVELRRQPIQRPRPNEVGNDIEPYVMRALAGIGYKVQRPLSKGGKGKATGYPDILFYDAKDRPCYLECKIYSDDTKDTSMRSFYLSPSDAFKVCMDARHLLLSFEMVRTPINNSNLSSFLPVAFKLVDLSALDCDMKYEFNADNRRLYSPKLVLLSGQC